MMATVRLRLSTGLRPRGRPHHPIRQLDIHTAHAVLHLLAATLLLDNHHALPVARALVDTTSILWAVAPAQLTASTSTLPALIL